MRSKRFSNYKKGNRKYNNSKKNNTKEAVLIL